MNIVIFIGPTITVAEAKTILDATYLPPAAHGDVYRAALRRPQVIGIVDGVFDSVPSIWHKEILWAMSQGIHVFGSASMGALRATELAAFGMEGIGSIYQAYASGELEDDDEVAVIHGPIETGYTSLSEALVNIRATLKAATASNILSAATAEALLAQARSTFYVDRNYQRLLGDAGELGLPENELVALRNWLPHRRVDQKHADACEMLRHIQKGINAGISPKQVRYHFEHTVFWDRAIRTLQPMQDATPDEAHPSAVLDELRLNPTIYKHIHAQAVRRGLAQVLAVRQEYTPDVHEVQQHIDDFRRVRTLAQGHAMDRWLTTHDLQHEQFVQLMYQRAQLSWAAAKYIPHLAQHLLDELRLDEHYETLAKRAYDKQYLLDMFGLANPNLLDTGLSHDAIVDWFFTQHLSQPVPDDLWVYLRELGYANEDTFLRSILREYQYAQRSAKTQIRSAT